MKFIVRLFIFCFFQFAVQFSSGQYKITFLVKQKSVLHSRDHLFIAGNFNSWNPCDKNFEFAADKNGIAKITISLLAGNCEYKFTRSSWDKVETLTGGKGISNRTLQISGDTIINVEIKGWSDDFSTVILMKMHTASANVKIIDTAFFIPQLKRNRRIWIYLPPDYKIAKKHYSVLYMHDGQNLFDNATSYSGEWA